MPKRPLKRASDLSKEFLNDPEYVALYREVVNEEIGAALRTVRKARELSQHEVAMRMGVTRARISQIESVEGTALALGVLNRYAHAVGCHLDITLKNSSTSDAEIQLFVPAVPEPEMKTGNTKTYESKAKGSSKFPNVLSYHSWARAA